MLIRWELTAEKYCLAHLSLSLTGYVAQDNSEPKLWVLRDSAYSVLDHDPIGRVAGEAAPTQDLPGCMVR